MELIQQKNPHRDGGFCFLNNMITSDLVQQHEQLW